MPEFKEDGRRLVVCGALTVRASALRIVENFLDMAHFPYVHTGILGEELITAVNDYKIEIREPEDEVWATEAVFSSHKLPPPRMTVRSANTCTG